MSADVLSKKLTTVLDIMASITKFQTRPNYAPWISKETKKLKTKREAAHKKAAETGNPEDWRIFWVFRNKVRGKCREDERRWERDKLDAKNSSTDIRKTVKGWLG